MTDDERITPPDDSTSETSSSDAASDERNPNATNRRQFILLGVMLVLAAALAYDFLVARPAAQAAYDSIKEVTDSRLDSTQPQFTNVEIREHLKRAPATTIVGPRYDIDVFQWRAGLPWRTYYCKVVYRKANDEQRYCSMFLNEEADAEYLPDWQPDQPGVAGPSTDLPPDAEGLDEEPPDGIARDGDSDPSNRPQRPQRPDGAAPPNDEPNEDPSAESPAAETP